MARETSFAATLWELSAGLLISTSASMSMERIKCPSEWFFFFNFRFTKLFSYYLLSQIFVVFCIMFLGNIFVFFHFPRSAKVILLFDCFRNIWTLFRATFEQYLNNIWQQLVQHFEIYLLRQPWFQFSFCPDVFRTYGR